jgi:hypothetical protein
MEVNINHAAVKTMSKEQFVEMMQHHKADIDLESEYDKIVPPTKKAEAKAPAKNEKPE